MLSRKLNNPSDPFHLCALSLLFPLLFSSMVFPFPPQPYSLGNKGSSLKPGDLCRAGGRQSILPLAHRAGSRPSRPPCPEISLRSQSASLLPDETWLSYCSSSFHTFRLRPALLSITKTPLNALMRRADRLIRRRVNSNEQETDLEVASFQLMLTGFAHEGHSKHL